MWILVGRNEVILAKLRDEDFLFNPAFLKSRTPDLSCLPAFDIKLQWTHSKTFRAQELCENWGGRPVLPIPNSLYSLCGRKASLNSKIPDFMCDWRLYPWEHSGLFIFRGLLLAQLGGQARVEPSWLSAGSKNRQSENRHTEPSPRLTVPHIILKSDDARSFQYQAPVVWNSRLWKIRLTSSLSSFKYSRLNKQKLHVTNLFVCTF